jgi:copper homeostasis protein (lipoprotein)
VLIDGAHLDLERAYLAQGEGGRWVLATLQGRFVMHEPEPGLPPREVIVVERFERLWPGETCAADAPATAALLNTRWRLVEVDGQPVTLAAGEREPFLQLSGEGNRVRGFGGCNVLSGRFEQGSDGFQFKALASTRRACAGAAGAQEASYLAALQATASRQIVGDALWLRDAQGRVRLRFEALYLR